MVFFGKILKEENGLGNNFKEHFLADGESYGGSFYSESNDPFVISTNTQCPRTDLVKTFLPRPKTIPARKLVPHSLKSARIEIPHIGSHYIDFSKTEFY